MLLECPVSFLCFLLTLFCVNSPVPFMLQAMLIPDLPKKYPHQLLRIDIEATGMPSVTFTQEKGINLKVGPRGIN